MGNTSPSGFPSRLHLWLRTLLALLLKSLGLILVAEPYASVLNLCVLATGMRLDLVVAVLSHTILGSHDDVAEDEATAELLLGLYQSWPTIAAISM